MEPPHDRVAAFSSEHLDIPADRITPEFALSGDSGIDGADGSDLLENLGRQLGVDMSACDVRRQFGPEGLPPWSLIYGLILTFRRGTPEERALLAPVGSRTS